MMKLFPSRTLFLVFFILFSFASTLSQAAVPQWQIVQDKSKLSFAAVQNGSPAVAEFKHFTGDIRFDPNNLTESSVQMNVDMPSVSAPYAQLIETLVTPPWFDVKQFPQAVFKSTQFTKTGDKTYQANGILTMRDKTVPVVLNFVMDVYTPTQAHLTGNAVIRRTQFGIGQGEWANTDVVKDNVKINFELTAVKK